MNLYDSLPDAAPTVFGAEAVGEFAYDVLTVDVPVGSWIPALEIARDKLGCTYFDWLSAVDEPGTGFRICAHVASLENHRVRRLLLRTTVPHSAPSLPSAIAVYAGAEWHERETFEMFGVTFTDHPNLVPLLLPENFEGHPLRKDFVLAARVAKAWPGAKEPGEAHDPDAPKRRQMLPPGVPDPNDWGPMKGQLPPAPARPARTPRAAGAAGAAARTPREGAPVRRTRSVTEGSATQPPADAATGAEEAPPRPPRRTRSVSEGSASQSTPAVAAPEESAETAPRPPRRTRSVADGSASQTPAPAPAPSPDGAAAGAAPEAGEAAPRRPAPRSSDAPWHDPKPAFEEPAPGPAPKAAPETGTGPDPKADPKTGPAAGDGSRPANDPTTDPDNGGDA
ncbi:MULTISPECIES: NADH-quinone oxidoreductase subunit C [Streptomyces]|uniref:Dehydrogenase n=1 Tax=Streptomyces spororaveus TaxID=284039 RepID=A0ABQ3TDF3_9ACTN|nr:MULTISPECIES: NADH-quinone oxidoreductase subunit C [Streptomyces]MCM9081199.1 NADH-quinone oxidoreductase subunit C [Streptomyces spororaveus]MCX5304354.1 NADH-quinone oxidoreductase subunit C [Streptomyces sp. NBC_00160]GHI78406.1 dehydrogenase [Streptomyces spororaveus]